MTPTLSFSRIQSSTNYRVSRCHSFCLVKIKFTFKWKEISLQWIKKSHELKFCQHQLCNFIELIFFMSTFFELNFVIHVNVKSFFFLSAICHFADRLIFRVLSRPKLVCQCTTTNETTTKKRTFSEKVKCRAQKKSDRSFVVLGTFFFRQFVRSGKNPN